MLETGLLLRAYEHGFFPMAVDAEGRIGWFCPDPRAIIPLDEQFHVPHGLRRRLKRNPYRVTVDQAFSQVIRACATSHGETWISWEIILAYERLHRAGHAHSVECWEESTLVGGLYGVSIGGAFFGESMYHRAPDASKIALVTLVERLRARGFSLLDTQWLTPHLEQFGACTIPKEDYLTRLKAAVAQPCRFGE